MGSYAYGSGGSEPSEEPEDDRAKLGDLLSGRFADVDVDSVAAVREERTTSAEEAREEFVTDG